jgi:hypothetical protein
MTVETSLASITIRNNIIDQGRFSDGTNPITYNYDNHAWIHGSSLIEGNTFVGPKASSDMLNLDTCSCLVKNNKFIRGSTAIGSYIRNYGSVEQTITDNIFDSPTIDGTVQTLALNLVDTSIYERNRNQTKNIAILPSAGEYRAWNYSRSWSSTSNYSAAVLTGGAGDGGFRYTAISHIDSDTVTVGPQRYVEYFVNLSNYVPKGAQIVEHLIGMKIGTLGTNIDATATSSMVVRISETLSSTPINGSFSSPSTTFALIPGTQSTGGDNLNTVTTTTTSITSGNYNTTTNWYNSNTYYSSSYINNESVNIIAAIKYAFTTTSTTDLSSVLWSPLLIKYRWM